MDQETLSPREAWARLAEAGAPEPYRGTVPKPLTWDEVGDRPPAEMARSTEAKRQREARARAQEAAQEARKEEHRRRQRAHRRRQKVLRAYGLDDGSIEKAVRRRADMKLASPVLLYAPDDGGYMLAFTVVQTSAQVSVRGWRRRNLGVEAKGGTLPQLAADVADALERLLTYPHLPLAGDEMECHGV